MNGKKLSTDCVNVSSMNIFKNKIDKYLNGGLLIDEQFMESQYVNGFLVHFSSGPFALDGNLVKSC